MGAFPYFSPSPSFSPLPKLKKKEKKRKGLRVYLFIVILFSQNLLRLFLTVACPFFKFQKTIISLFSDIKVVHVCWYDLENTKKMMKKITVTQKTSLD